MSKNEGLQIFVKMDLECSTYSPEHKTERFRSIEVIVNFWEPVEVGKNGVFLTNTALCSSGHFVKEIFEYPSFYDFYFF
jgi:alpha-L-fucosidase